jgi:outer membrane biosynthesis protein TonB
MKASGAKPRRGAAAIAAALLLATGCQSNEGKGWSDAPPAGSIGDINRKMTGRSADGSAADRSSGSQEIVLVVAYDAAGVPQYVETQRSSGDPALDRRAQDYVLKHHRFPKGAPNAVTVTMDPKRVPKAPKP